MHKTALAAEAHENVAKVQEKLMEEDIEKMVDDAYDESYSKKKDKKKDDDDDDNDDHNDQALVKNKVMSSSETRKEKMQTPIPSPHRSTRTNLSLDKTIYEELMVNVSPTPATTSQDPSKCQGFMIKQLEKKFVTKCEFQGIKENVDKVLHEIIPQIASNATNDIIEDNLPRVIVDTIIQERDTFLAYVPALISKEFVDHAPTIIEELFKNYINNNVITIYPTTNYSTATTTTDLQHQLYLKMKSNLQDQGYDAPPEGEKRVKRQKTSKSLKFARDEDEEISKDETHELINEFQNIDKRIPTIYDHAIMEVTLNDMMSNPFRNAKEYAHHLEQSKNYLENQTYGNSEEKSYVLSLHKIHVVPFLEEDLEEKMNRWVRKDFKTFNEEAGISIQHWKDLWHMRMYELNKRKVRDNPDEYFSNHRIVKVVRITSDQKHGLDYIEQIIMMRENDKPNRFSESDYKYLNKNDFEDMYYLLLNKKVNHHKNKLRNSLMTFIRSYVIWERVHDF
ncbi:hypothetical protein Tco_1443905 [Tanacetum coccineum]